MKSIIDFYECGLNATPGNTTGMGNPMPATETTPGSEPLTAKPCKKCKKKKSQNVDEASILDIEGTLDAVDNDILMFAQWLVDSQIEFRKLANPDIKTVDRGAAIAAECELIKMESKGHYVIDTDFDKAMKLVRNSNFDHGVLTFVPSGIPKFIKSIKLINVGQWGTRVTSMVNDLSKIDIQFFEDNGKSLADVDFFFSRKVTKTVKLPKIECNALKVRTGADTLVVKPDSIALSVDLDSCDAIADVIGRFPHADKLILPRKLVANILARTGFIPNGAQIQLTR